jgi:hypothetical protein
MGNLRLKMAGAAITGGLSVACGGDPTARREPDAIVVEDRTGDDGGDRIVLYFHPEVPEATMVLVR